MSERTRADHRGAAVSERTPAGRPLADRARAGVPPLVTVRHRCPDDGSRG